MNHVHVRKVWCELFYALFALLASLLLISSLFMRNSLNFHGYFTIGLMCALLSATFNWFSQFRRNYYELDYMSQAYNTLFYTTFGYVIGSVHMACLDIGVGLKDDCGYETAIILAVFISVYFLLMTKYCETRRSCPRGTPLDRVLLRMINSD